MITVFSGIVIGAASAEALVLSVGEGAGAAFDALEVSPPEPGVDVAAGWPAGAGSLLAFGLFPQAAEKMQRLAIKDKANFFELLGITCSSWSEIKILAHRGAESSGKQLYR